MPVYLPSESRYDDAPYNRCGRSGLKLPAVSLGLWHNFGGVDTYENGPTIVRRAFDRGVTHFDLANNYGPPPDQPEIFGECCGTTWLLTAMKLLSRRRRAGTDVAGSLRGFGLAQVPGRQPGPEPEADGP